MIARPALVIALLVAASCAPEQPRRPEQETQANEADSAAPAPPPPTAPTGPPADAQPDPLIGEERALAEWRKAANRESCAPLALASDGGVPARDRRAEFSSGWAVAFDSPTVRSLYGFAGTGLLPEDAHTDHAYEVGVIRRQWPHGRASAGLPEGSFAGYGLEGAKAYSSANPQGRGQHSLAYLRIPGQSCLYNVWSRVSRAHLETLLDSLRLVGGG